MASPDRIISLPQAPLLQEPSPHQIDRIRLAELDVPQATAFAFDLGILTASNIEPNSNYEVDGNALRFHERIYSRGAVTEIVADPNSASMGLVLTEIDTKRVPDGRGGKRDIRLDTNPDGSPVLLQMGSEGIKSALAARAAEFLTMHSPDMHEHVRKLQSGEINPQPRTNTRSRVLEDALGMEVESKGDGSHKISVRPDRSPVGKVISTKELSYARQFAGDKTLSRRTAGTTGLLMVGPDGVVSSVFALGGMPPVTGSVDSVVTASMSYMRSWIPRNGVFAGDFDRQLAVFKEAKARIESYGLPDNITANAIKLIGISVGSERPEEIAEQVKRFEEAGGHAARIYTTSPDSRVVRTARAIRDIAAPDFFTAVGPVVDAEQSRALHDDAGVNEYLIGHGGGENCTSLAGGGAANSLSILYEMYLDSRFNDTMIGLEGGTGTNIGALLPMVDVLSVNKRGAGGIESTGGIYAVKKGLPVLPYHGSASAVTKLTEYYMLEQSDPDKARRIVGPDGMVLNVEGMPNYMQMKDSARSITLRFKDMRELARVVADQRSDSLYELRRQIAEHGHNHLITSYSAAAVADEHR